MSSDDNRVLSSVRTSPVRYSISQDPTLATAEMSVNPHADTVAPHAHPAGPTKQTPDYPRTTGSPYSRVKDHNAARLDHSVVSNS